MILRLLLLSTAAVVVLESPSAGVDREADDAAAGQHLFGRQASSFALPDRDSVLQESSRRSWPTLPTPACPAAAAFQWRSPIFPVPAICDTRATTDRVWYAASLPVIDHEFVKGLRRVRPSSRGGRLLSEIIVELDRLVSRLPRDDSDSG